MKALDKVKSGAKYIWSKKRYRYTIIVVSFLYLTIQHNFLWLMSKKKGVIF